jgi:2-C-methyl-D-erythritol 4-phosphate cytidylyltransferase
MQKRDVGVVIAAAGSGDRFGKPKQFETLGGLAIYQHVVRTFSRIPAVGAIVVVTRDPDCPEMERGLSALNLVCEWRVISGGKTRQESVANGLRELQLIGQPSIALVQDVARALVSEACILNVIEAIRTHGAAIAAIPLVDTLKRVKEGGVIETVSRQNLWRAQTPQGALLADLLAAFDAARAAGYQGTDEAELLERIGKMPSIVEGSELNFKITYPTDLEWARTILANRR